MVSVTVANARSATTDSAQQEVMVCLEAFSKKEIEAMRLKTPKCHSPSSRKQQTMLRLTIPNLDTVTDGGGFRPATSLSQNSTAGDEADTAGCTAADRERTARISTVK